MAERVKPRRSVVNESDVPVWANILVTDEMPILWDFEDGEPEPGGELAGRLRIGEEEQVVIDMCGSAATGLLKVLIVAHLDADVRLPIADLAVDGYDGEGCPLT